VYYVLEVEMIVFGGEKCVGIEGSDGVPWWKGPSADGEGLGPVLDAGGLPKIGEVGFIPSLCFFSGRDER
jgi:hypothetical protein